MITDFLNQWGLVPTRLIAGSDEITWIRTFPARPDALAIPFPISTGSPVWITDYMVDDPPLGQQGPIPPGTEKRPTTWVPRRRRYPAPPGQHWHGLPEWFLTGLPADQLTPPPYLESCGAALIDADGSPECGGVVTVLPGPAMIDTGGPDETGVVDIHGGSMPANWLVDKVDLGSLDSGPYNDYDLGDGGVFRFTSSSPTAFSGFAGGLGGRLVVLENYGDFQATITSLDGASSAANQFRAINGTEAVIFGRSSLWMVYNTEEDHWVEIANVPYIRGAGDLITGTNDGPFLLRVGDDQSVLTADSSVASGLKWKPVSELPGVGADWWYWPPGTEGDVPFTRYVVAAYGVGGLAGNDSIQSNMLYVLPLPRPRGGTFSELHVYVVTPGIPPMYCSIGVYSNLGTGLAYPKDLLASAVDVDVSGLGDTTFPLDDSVTLEPGALIWIVLLADQPFNATIVSSVTTPGGPYPILGFSEPASLNSGYGYTVGYDPSGMGANGWDYSRGLPTTFPDPDDVIVVAPLEAGSSPSGPAIFIAFDG
jgi:hypothetical protein